MIKLPNNYYIKTQKGGYGYALYKSIKRGKTENFISDITYHKDVISAISEYRRIESQELIKNRDLTIGECLKELKKMDKEFYDTLLETISNDQLSVVMKEIKSRTEK